MSLLPSSHDGLARSAGTHAINTDDASQELVDLCVGVEFVDLGKDLDLGFSEV